MTINSKYIVYLYKAIETIIIFPETLQHSHVAISLAGSKDAVISAGFIRRDNNNMFLCYGESISLDKASRADTDANLINRSL